MKKIILILLLAVSVLFVMRESLKSDIQECKSDLNDQVENNKLREGDDTYKREVILKTQTKPYSYEIFQEFNIKTNQCRLILLASSYKSNLNIDISHPHHNCSVYGDVTTIGYYDYDSSGGSSYLFIEAAYGGDGDHTPTIVSAFKANKSGLIKLGEQELVNVSYIRKNESIERILGDEVINLCAYCDSWQSASEEQIIFIPVKITIGCNGLCKNILLSEQEKDNILNRMYEYRKLVENDIDKSSTKDELLLINKSTEYVSKMFGGKE